MMGVVLGYGVCVCTHVRKVRVVAPFVGRRAGRS